MYSLFFYFILTLSHYVRFKDGNGKATANGIKQSPGNSDEVGLILCCMDSRVLMRISLGFYTYTVYIGICSDLVLEIIYIRYND